MFPEDGSDVLLNIEQLRFANGGCLDITGDEPVSCVPAGEVALALPDGITVPTIGEPVTATVTLAATAPQPVGALTYTWQTSDSPDGPWATAAGTGGAATYTPVAGDLTSYLRVSVSYQVSVNGVTSTKTIVSPSTQEAVNPAAP